MLVLRKPVIYVTVLKNCVTIRLVSMATLYSGNDSGDDLKALFFYTDWSFYQ